MDTKPALASKLCNAECSYKDGRKSLKSGLTPHQIFLNGFIKGFIKWWVTKKKRRVSILETSLWIWRSGFYGRVARIVFQLSSFPQIHSTRLIMLQEFSHGGATLEGIESINMIRKGQVKRLSGNDA